MVDLCNSTKGICLTGMFIALNIAPMLALEMQNSNIFKELEVNDYVKELRYLFTQNLHINGVIY